MNDWIPNAPTTAPNDVVIETKIDDEHGVRNQSCLIKRRSLWFFPDGSMHVYYAPTHWRLLVNKYKPYRNPGFMDGEPGPPAVEFKTLEELLSLDDIKRTRTPDTQYVMDGRWLMSLTKDGFEWWVLGSIESPSLVKLPKWKGPKIKVRYANGYEGIVEGDEVRVICGDEITLKDGIKVRRLSS